MKPKMAICLVLAVATLAVYWQVGSSDFINFDDPGYVYENAHVVSGLTPGDIRWAFTTVRMGNWHPLTWLSHMADCQLYGLDPTGHHFSSLILHIFNAVLLFLLLSRLSGAVWRSAFVAALFALHPLHVESVAWVSERKDVLSTLFWMLTMLAYARYVDRPGWRRYSLVLLCFGLGLMAKPMLVTLPFVLLLIDYWPLGRMRFGETASGDAKHARSAMGTGSRLPLPRLIMEKAPLFALAAISSAITIYAQQKGGAISSLGTVPLQVRVSNALLAWAGYIGKMVWPRNLAFLYPLERTTPAWEVASAGALLLCVTLLAVTWGRKHPYLPVGWFWYLGTLIPVIGLVQVGLQSMADRYTYVPLVGLFMMIAWGVPDLLRTWNRRHAVLAVAAVGVLAALAAVTWQRLGYWKNSIALFSQAIEVTSNNFVAHNNLGTALAALGRNEEAASHYRAALAINPGYSEACYNLANQLSGMNRPDEALGYYRKAVQLQPGNARYQNNLGVALAMAGKEEEAMARFSEAVRLDPDYADAQYNLGIALMAQGRVREAAGHFSAAVRLRPRHADARRRLEEALRLLAGEKPTEMKNN